MIVAIPVDNSKSEEIGFSFGRTPFFMLYNTETEKSEFMDNSAAASQGGAGIKASQMLADNGVNVVITPRLGQNAADVLDDAQIRIYKSQGTDIAENLRALVDGSLQLLKEVHEGFHKHGGQ